MKYFVRLRYRYKKSCVVFLITCTCFTFLYLLVRNRRSVLSPQFFDDYQQLQPRIRLPGAFLEGVHPSNISYCTFKYGLPDQLVYRYSDLSFSAQLGEESSYRIIYNVIESTVNHTTPAVTFCTHLTPHFVGYLAEIVENWDGAISVSAFVPDSDANMTINAVKQLCYCLPGMERMSMHFVFPENRPPRVESFGVISKCSITDMTNVQTFRNKEHLPYPVNVCRNSARVAVRSSHILVADVELIPSKNLSTLFVRMLKSFRNLHVLYNHVFVVPVFEVDNSVEEIPRTKKALKQLYDEEKAVYFHRYVCSHCQKFPGLVKWLNKPIRNAVKPFIVVRREYPYHRWEPVYIGTNKEPFYSETLSWEGQQDKMTQMVEMCLIGYKLVVLDGAFLVHWPGIKRRNTASRFRNAWRRPHQRTNTRQYEFIINSLAAKYVENDKCKL